MGKHRSFTVGAITIILVAALALAGVSSAARSGRADAPGPVKRACGQDEIKYKKVVKKRKKTSLHSDLVEGPGTVSVTRGREATQGSSITSTGGDGGGVGIEFAGFKADWNESHSRAFQISKSVSQSLSETITYHVPRHKVGQIIVRRAKLYIKVIRLHSNPDCKTIRSHYLVKAPLKHAPLLFTLKLYGQG